MIAYLLHLRLIFITSPFVILTFLHKEEFEILSALVTAALFVRLPLGPHYETLEYINAGGTSNSLIN